MSVRHRKRRMERRILIGFDMDWFHQFNGIIGASELNHSNTKGLKIK
jgi:hypothetical protein